MQINDYEVADPTRFDKTLSVLEAVNEALDGVVVSQPFDSPLIATIRLTWDAVTEEEMAVMRNAFDMLLLNYVYVQFTYLGDTWTDGVSTRQDAFIATLAPNSAPKIQLNQETTFGTAYASRTYTVEAELMGYPTGI